MCVYIYIYIYIYAIHRRKKTSEYQPAYLFKMRDMIFTGSCRRKNFVNSRLNSVFHIFCTF